MYNYAKIEVIVDSNNLKEAITNSIVILSSIDYNKDVLANIIGDNVLQFNEETYDIFKTKKQDSDFLDVESNNIYDNNDENTKEEDPDLIN